MQQKRFKILLLFFLVAFWLTTILFFGFSVSNAANSNTNSSKSPPIQLKLQQPFGGLSTITISGSSIGEYIEAVYKFGSAAIVGLAIVMVIVSGIQWILAAGDSGKITSAKDRMIKAFTGLFIALFAVFMLRTLSPATVTFKSITPSTLGPGTCCEKAGAYSYTPDDTTCTSGGGTIAGSEKCLGGNTGSPSTPPPTTCNALNGLADCYADACGTAGTPTEKMTPSGGDCLDPTKPNCCLTPPSSLKDCTASTAATVCTSDEYCSDGTPTGKCEPKRDSGANCMERVLGPTTGTTLGGGANEVCKSNVCAGLTKAGLNKCVPKLGEGRETEYCTQPGQCDEIGKYGKKLSCARSGFPKPVGNTDCAADTEEGTCQPKAAPGVPCDSWSTSDDDLVCISGSCDNALFGCGGACEP